MTTGPADDYFDQRMVNRSRLFWTVATRRQLERWEPYVAAHIYAQFGRRHVLHDGDIWLAELEHHFALVATRNLIHALEVEPASTVALDPTIRAELIEGRDLLEHWVDNLPVFNVSPRSKSPVRRSGRDFAARNPDRGPYWWLGWSSYVLPIVFGDRFVGRIEPRIDLEDAAVRVLNLWWEDGFAPRRADGFVDAMRAALRAYLRFAGANRLDWTPHLATEKRLFLTRP